MVTDEVLERLKQLADTGYLTGMKRFGIDSSRALGVSLPQLRKLAKEIKQDHLLALGLWDSGIHEARILASLVDDPKLVTPAQMDNWSGAFYSWDLCDQVCGNLFDRTPYVTDKVTTYTADEREFVKRAGFVLMAEYAVHNKQAPDEVFISWLPLIQLGSNDSRNFVKKAVSWALRQIGKRNYLLRKLAVATAHEINQLDNPSAKWIARDALKELS